MHSCASVFILTAWAALAVAFPAAAQTVYRCGPDGRSYSQQPCDDGRPLRVEDARSEAQRREAAAVAGRDARLARSLEHERLATRPQRLTAVGIDGRGSSASDPTKAAATKKRRKSRSNDAEFRAAVPRPTKTKPASTNG